MPCVGHSDSSSLHVFSMGLSIVYDCSPILPMDRMHFVKELEWTQEPAYLFAACIICTAVPLTSTFPNASVFLVSDKLTSLGLSSYLPPGMLSSPLALTDARQPLHIDFASSITSLEGNSSVG